MTFKKCLPAALLSCSVGVAVSATAATVDMGDAGKLELKADAFVKTYHLDKGEGTSGSEHGAQSRVRLTMNMINDAGWSINTRFSGFYDWAGDRRHTTGAGSNYTSGNNIDSLSLDLAYLEYRGIDSWLFRIGRQEATWGYGFLASDDRRDRIAIMKTKVLDTGWIRWLGVYDLRFADEHTERENPYGGEFTGDLNMYLLGAVGEYNSLKWGILGLYFDGEQATYPNLPNAYMINDSYIVSPYFLKTMDQFSFKGGANFIFSDANNDAPKYSWGNDSWSALFEGSYQATPKFQLQGQVATFADGGIVGRGWDSYSMLINNSPRNELNPVSGNDGFFGGFGNRGNYSNSAKDGLLYGLRANWNTTERLKLTFAVGQMDVDFNAHSKESTFYDIKALYQFNPTNTLEVRAGHADGDLDDTAVMTTLRVNFG